VIFSFPAFLFEKLNVAFRFYRRLFSHLVLEFVKNLKQELNFGEKE